MYVDFEYTRPDRITNNMINISVFYYFERLNVSTLEALNMKGFH